MILLRIEPLKRVESFVIVEDDVKVGKNGHIVGPAGTQCFLQIYARMLVMFLVSRIEAICSI